MSFPSLDLAPPPSVPALRSGPHLAHELTSLVDEIQRTRDWFNTQIEAQLSSLKQLRAAMQSDDPTSRASLASLFEAAPPVVATEVMPPPAPMVPSAPVSHGGTPMHQAIVLPPTNVTTLDPELEQATLRELNDALSKAFSEISSRGGMLG